jgi:hypothetical protein
MTNIIKINFRPYINQRQSLKSIRLLEWSYMLELLGESGDLIKLMNGVMITHEKSVAKGDTWRIYEVMSGRLTAYDIESNETIIDFIDRSVGIEFYEDAIKSIDAEFEPSNAHGVI